ncbi:MAG: HlyD family efflux transporter periplasmic adaptor subunit [Methylotenera sp.]|nr:HlyD family efflux transporter periplasmic adaptor subunit [Methylotenera sp.]
MNTLRNHSAMRESDTPAFVQSLSKYLLWLFFIIPMIILFFPWLQNIQGIGMVTAYHPSERRQTVDAPISGVINKWFVQEGTKVKAGDVLLEMADVDPNFQERLGDQLTATTDKLAAKKEELKSYQTQLQSFLTVRDARTSAASFKRDMAKQRVLSATETIHAAEATLAATQYQLTRMERLLGEGLVSKRDQELADRDHALATRALNSAKAQLDAARAEERSADADITQIRADVQTSIDKANAQINKLLGEIADSQNNVLSSEINLARQQAQKMIAPRAGTVFRLPINSQSQIISRGQPLLVIVPENNQRAVELYVDGRDAPLVVKDSIVRLEFEGWPAVQVSGWPNVAIGTFAGKVSFVDATDDGTGIFRVMVIPDEREQKWPEDRFLRQGTSVSGWVLLEQVTIGYEIWRLLNGFPPRLPKAPEAGTKK